MTYGIQVRDYDGDNKVMVINLNPGFVRHEFLGSIINLIVHDFQHDPADRLLAEFNPRNAGGCLSIYRNQAVEYFMSSGHEFLLFVDSDMEVPPDTADILTKAMRDNDMPILSGLYMMPLQEGLCPSMFDWQMDPDLGLPRMHAHETIPADSLVQVDGLGAGCLMLHRSLLRAMTEVYAFPEPWFGQDIVDGVINGEDFTLCHRLRKMGVDIFVHTGVQCTHIKTSALHPSQHGTHTTTPFTPLNAAS